MGVRILSLNFLSGAIMSQDKPWILTYTGREFHSLDPDPAEVDLKDIAHHLSLKCRFAGATRTMASVALHSVMVSQLLPHNDPLLQLQGLLHDAAEAYWADIPTPFKNDPRLKELMYAIEDRILRAVFTGLGIPFPSDEQWYRINVADRQMCQFEAQQKMGRHPAWDEKFRDLAPQTRFTFLSELRAETVEKLFEDHFYAYRDRLP
jgi:hypothetical protein